MGDPPISGSSRGLCGFCLKNVCHSNKTWDTHHPTFKSLRKSAFEGCLFCCTLLEDLKGSGLHLPSWPFHRWNLRKLGATRECKQLVLLTFRPIPSDFVPEINLWIESLPDRVFHFYEEQDLGRLPTVTDLDTSTDSSRSLSQIQQWITTCEEKHHRCGRRRKEPDSVPTHLLDITEINLAPKDSARIRVVLTAKQGIREPYVTLSHRWADSAEFIQLTKSNMESLTTIGFEWCDPLLPKTFKDAILLARRMDISYMWIDSLCIIQERKPHQNNPEDNTPETETQKESKLMHRYYRNSFCNISTADSGSGQEGLFRQRDPASSEGSIRSSIIPPTVVAGASNLIFGGSTWRVVPDSLWDTQLLGNVLYTRAWVFQERMLSPRILHFSKNQVFWECSTISACEGIPDGLPLLSNTTAIRDRHWRSRLQVGFSLHQRPLAGEDDESMDTLWKNAVREYTRCELTEAADKLIAIWSVAKLVKDALDEDYQAGLWSGKLEEQLAWKVVDCRQTNGDPSVRINSHNTPSWSWASLHGMIEPCDRSRGSGELERVDTVVHHSGRQISFQKEFGRSKSEPLDVVRLSTFLDRGHQALATSKKNAGTAPSVQSSDQPPVFKDSRIAIQGHLRQGHLSFSADTGKWELVPWPLNHQPYTNSNATEHESHYASDIVGDNVTALTEVFPDLDPGDPLSNPSCWLVVLAYSKNPGPIATYSGVGLMLQLVKDAHFERVGAFHFNEISKNVMRFLTLMPGQDLQNGFAGQHSHDQYVVRRQADNFWLV